MKIFQVKMERVVLLVVVISVVCAAEDRAVTGETAGASVPTAYATSVATADCPVPFDTIGGRCLLVDNLPAGNWQEARYVCTRLGGEIAKIGSADLLADIVDYIHNWGLTDVHYWIGAADEAHTGNWVWTDGSSTRLGTPFWGDLEDQIQKPDGNGDCAYLNRDDHYFFHNYLCDDTSNLFGVICEY